MGVRRNILRLLAVLFAFAFIAAACGGDDDSSSSSSSESETTADDHGDGDHDHEEEETGGGLSQDAVENAVSGDDDAEEEVDEEAPSFDTSTMEGLEASWEYNREKLVAMVTEKMESGEWGVGSDNILRGPTGFEIDLNDCPSDWSDPGGLTADAIRIGHTTAQSGNLAAYGNIAYGWDSYNKYVNENGGIAGRDI